VKPPTARQTQVLRIIAARTLASGYPPSLRELCDLVGIASTNGVSDHCTALERKGMLTVTPRVSRGMVLTPAGHAYLAQCREPAPESFLGQCRELAPEPAPAPTTEPSTEGTE
jgi:SOS-response transcriptional repressor LexA